MVKRLMSCHSADLEGRKREGVRKDPCCVAQDFERQMQAFGHLALVTSGLSAQAE
jgi:hypothetical protein